MNYYPWRSAVKAGLLAILLLGAGTTPGRADLDPEANAPYKLQIVLRLAEHRLLTPVFREQVRRELRDSLQAGFGNMAQVDVVDKHPLLKEVEEKGLQRVLDGWHKVEDAKTHFVLIDYIDGRYEVRARQFDGYTGMASPVVRQAHTADRQLVARNAALLIDQDFGLVGTVGRIDGEKIELTIKGSGLGEPLERWLKKDEVFAVSQILNRGGGQGERVPFALMQAQDVQKNGICTCLLFNRYANPLAAGGGVLGYRCLKLGTTKSALRLRIVADDKLGAPLNGRQVQFATRGFQANVQEKRATNSDGLVRTERVYDNVAFVVVYDGNLALARVPIEIVDQRTVPIPVGAAPESENRSRLFQRRDRWTRRVFDSLEVASSLVRDLNATVRQSKGAALKKAKSGLSSLRADVTNLTEEKDSLLKDAEGLGKSAKLDLTLGEQRLAELQGQQTRLQGYIDQLEKIVVEDKDPKRQLARESAEQARLLEDNADYNEAIELYERILAENEDATLRKYVDTLKKEWAIKDAGHQKARSFIYETWALAEDSAAMKAKLEKAKEAFVTCKGAGDALSLRKLLRISVLHRGKLTKEFDALRPQEKDDDKKVAEIIKEVEDELSKLTSDLTEYLKNAKLPGS